MHILASARRGAPGVLLDLRVQRAAAAACLLLGWQLAAGRVSTANYLSSPLAVGRQIAQWLTSGFIWPHLLATAETTLAGFALAAFSGVLLAIAIGSVRLADEVLSPLIFIAYAAPKVVLAPMLILWVGVGRPPAIILAFVAGFFMVFFNTLNGIRAVPRAHLNLAAILGAGPLATAFKFRVPAAAPLITTGLQQGLIYAFHGAVLGEMTASNTGIGYVVVFAATSMDSTAVIAALCVIGVFSYLLVIALEKCLRGLSAPPASVGASGGAMT